VAELTIGYRVPAHILAVANTLLERAEVAVPASRSARTDGAPPTVRIVAPDEVASTAAAEVVELRRRHRLSGIIAPASLVAAVGAALEPHGLRAVPNLDHLGADEVPVLAAEASKGLELDGVVAVEPGQLVGTGARGARLAYVVLTRAVQELTVVTSAGVTSAGVTGAGSADEAGNAHVAGWLHGPARGS
jgi:DNA helicase IV